MKNIRKNKPETRSDQPVRRNEKPKARAKVMQRMDWEGIRLAVSYEPCWLNMAATAHLEVRVIEPKGAELPITDTGYRSHFISREEVERAGGAAAYVRTWLDQAAKLPAWKRRKVSSRQLCLL